MLPAAVLLGDEQRRPAQLGALAPVVGVEAVRRSSRERPDASRSGTSFSRNFAVVSRKNSWSSLSVTSIAPFLGVARAIILARIWAPRKVWRRSGGVLG